jgi:hypothetical protein
MISIETRNQLDKKTGIQAIERENPGRARAGTAASS